VPPEKTYLGRAGKADLGREQLYAFPFRRRGKAKHWRSRGKGKGGVRVGWGKGDDFLPQAPILVGKSCG